MNNFFTFSPTDVPTAVVLFNLIAALVISSFIAWVYRRTHSGLSYSQSFFITLVLIAPIAMIVIVIVQNNIFGALGLLGAFALIRFRTIVKETRDIAFLFFSLVMGVAIGAGHYATAALATVVISAVAYVLSRYKFGSVSEDKHILIFTSKQAIPEEEVQKKAHLGGIVLHLLSSKMIDGIYEYTYASQAKNVGKVEGFLRKLEKEDGLSSYDLISGKDTVEY